MNRLKFILLVFILFFSGKPSSFSEVPDHRITLSLGWLSTWMIALEYEQESGFSDELSWRARLSLPLFAEGFPANGKLEAGPEFRVPYIRDSPWFYGIKSSAGFTWSQDDLGQRWSLTADGALLSGWTDEKSAIAAELGLRSAVLSYLNHSETVQNCFQDRYPGDAGDTADSGPFLFTSQKLRAGLSTNFSTVRGLDFRFRAGWEHTLVDMEGGSPPVFPLPFYAELGGGYTW